MSDHEIRRETIVEREVPVEGRRTIVERRSGAGMGMGFNPVAGLIMALVLVLLVLLLFGVLV
ncbi:MAG TPA: hypothetical protein VEA78_12245 [Acidimicrobiales bacterium]|nr:hypothetical protein [Acidimicrobiales bacterium]